MTDRNESQNTSPVDPIFPRFFTNGEEPHHKLVGLIGYGLYEEARREWVDAFKGREKRYPTPAEVRAYETSWTSSRLEGLKNAAVQILSSYGDSVAREIETQALRGALKGSLFRSVVHWLFSAMVFGAAVWGSLIAASRAGLDPVGAFLGSLQPPQSSSSGSSADAAATPAVSSPAPGVGTPVTPPPTPQPPGTPVTPPPRSGR